MIFIAEYYCSTFPKVHIILHLPLNSVWRLCKIHQVWIGGPLTPVPNSWNYDDDVRMRRGKLCRPWTTNQLIQLLLNYTIYDI